MPHRNVKVSKIEGEKRSVARKECKRLRGNTEDAGVIAHTGVWHITRKGILEGQRCDAQGRKAIQADNTRPCTRIIFSVVGRGRTHKARPKTCRTCVRGP